MNKENTDQLIAICPDIFPPPGDGERGSSFCFECGDGWFDLLRECIERIKESVSDKDFKPFVTQVKEKYGHLRFYMNLTTEVIDDCIEHAEYRSSGTCEECGEAGKMRADGYWYLVRCDKCWTPDCGTFQQDIK